MKEACQVSASIGGWRDSLHSVSQDWTSMFMDDGRVCDLTGLPHYMAKWIAGNICGLVHNFLWPYVGIHDFVDLTEGLWGRVSCEDMIGLMGILCCIEKVSVTRSGKMVIAQTVGQVEVERCPEGDAMLVTFHTKAYADITMFGEIAIKLLKMMGLSGTVPSALMPEDIPGALENLQAALKRQAQIESPFATNEEEPVVSLSLRAAPLIELLEAALAAKTEVMWDK